MEEIARIVSQKYEIEVLDIEKIKNAYKVTTTDGLKCFKASKYDMRQYSFIMKVLMYLTEKGYPCIPKINKTYEGEDFIRYKDRYGFLCDWVDSREADFENPIELKLCVDSLARLHKASEGFQFNDLTNIRYIFGKWIERLKKRCDELLYFKALIVNKDKNSQSEFDNVYLNLFDKHYKQGIKTVRDLEKSSYSSIMKRHLENSYFCHHDTANHNFLITSDLSTYIIDFDYCIYDTFLHDIGSLLIRNLKYGNWSFAKLEYILGIYCSVIPMEDKELEIVRCFMEFPQDFWQIGLQYYVEKKIWNEEIFLKKLGRVSADMQDRNEFLAELAWRWGHA